MNNQKLLNRAFYNSLPLHQEDYIQRGGLFMAEDRQMPFQGYFNNPQQQLQDYSQQINHQSLYLSNSGLGPSQIIPKKSMRDVMANNNGCATQFNQENSFMIDDRDIGGLIQAINKNNLQLNSSFYQQPKLQSMNFINSNNNYDAHNSGLNSGQMQQMNNYFTPILMNNSSGNFNQSQPFFDLNRIENNNLQQTNNFIIPSYLKSEINLPLIQSPNLQNISSQISNSSQINQIDQNSKIEGFLFSKQEEGLEQINQMYSQKEDEVILNQGSLNSFSSSFFSPAPQNASSQKNTMRKIKKIRNQKLDQELLQNNDQIFSLNMTTFNQTSSQIASNQQQVPYCKKSQKQQAKYRSITQKMNFNNNISHYTQENSFEIYVDSKKRKPSIDHSNYLQLSNILTNKAAVDEFTRFILLNGQSKYNGIQNSSLLNSNYNDSNQLLLSSKDQELIMKYEQLLNQSFIELKHSEQQPQPQSQEVSEIEDEQKQDISKIEEDSMNNSDSSNVRLSSFKGKFENTTRQAQSILDSIDQAIQQKIPLLFKDEEIIDSIQLKPSGQYQVYSNLQNMCIQFIRGEKRKRFKERNKDSQYMSRFHNLNRLFFYQIMSIYSYESLSCFSIDSTLSEQMRQVISYIKIHSKLQLIKNTNNQSPPASVPSELTLNKKAKKSTKDDKDSQLPIKSSKNSKNQASEQYQKDYVEEANNKCNKNTSISMTPSPNIKSINLQDSYHSEETMRKSNQFQQQEEFSLSNDFNGNQATIKKLLKISTDNKENQKILKESDDTQDYKIDSEESYLKDLNRDEDDINNYDDEDDEDAEFPIKNYKKYFRMLKVENYTHSHYNTLFLKLNPQSLENLRKQSKDVDSHWLAYKIDIRHPELIPPEKIQYVNIMKSLFYKIFIHFNNISFTNKQQEQEKIIQSVIASDPQSNISQDSQELKSIELRLDYYFRVVQGIQKLNQGSYSHKF